MEIPSPPPPSPFPSPHSLSQSVCLSPFLSHSLFLPLSISLSLCHSINFSRPIKLKFTGFRQSLSVYCWISLFLSTTVLFIISSSFSLFFALPLYIHPLLTLNIPLTSSLSIHLSLSVYLKRINIDSTGKCLK